MTSKEAADFGIAVEAWRYIRIDDGKQNLKPPGEAVWTKSASQILPSGESVGVLQPWTPPKVFDGITKADAQVAQKVAQGGAFRASIQSPEWFGYALGNKAHKAKLNGMIKTWIKNKVLKIELRPDERRKDKEFIVPGPTIMSPNHQPDDDDE
jgi:hypothetical protein